MLVLLIGVLFSSPAPGSTRSVSTLAPDQLRKGMTGYGKTVFEGTRVDSFPVRILGVMTNVLPDQDLVLIEADSPLLDHTNIMSGMSGSPIYINGKLIGALAYSWSFEKDPIAGVTPIKNILESRRRTRLALEGRSLNPIHTPIVTSGFQQDVLKEIRDKLDRGGLRPRFMAGGDAASTTGDTPDPPLEPGSAVGVQLMRGDLGMTAIGTVTHRSGKSVYALGHPFMSAGSVEFPMTAATVHSPMPSLQSSFKLSSPLEPVGTVTEDRQASIVGQVGTAPDMLPLSIQLRSTVNEYRENFELEVVRNRFLTPGLINSAVANFARSTIKQLGINRIETKVRIRLRDHPDIRFQQSNLSGRSFDVWTFLPISMIWSNRFTTPRIESVRVNITLHPNQNSARISDAWVDREQVMPGDTLQVFTRIDPFREAPFVRRTPIHVPSRMGGSVVRVHVVPARKRARLDDSPQTLDQLIQRLNSLKGPDRLAVVLEYAQLGLLSEGHRLQNVPFSIAGAYQDAFTSSARPSTSVQSVLTGTDWILQGEHSFTLPLKQP